jgi:hypothetical protein
VSTWRDELLGIIKTEAEREAEQKERRKKRIAAALEVASEAFSKAEAGLRFAHEKIAGKKQPAALDEGDDSCALALHDLSLRIELRRDVAVLDVTYGEGKPREFDFANDRHLAPRDIEDYVGRRVIELARTAQELHPW